MTMICTLFDQNSRKNILIHFDTLCNLYFSNCKVQAPDWTPILHEQKFLQLIQQIGDLDPQRKNQLTPPTELIRKSLNTIYNMRN